MTLHFCALPTELHAQIFLLLPQVTLMTVLTVSLALHDEALRALYTAPHLKSHYGILAFFSVITQRPALAAHVHELELSLTHAGTPQYSRTVLEFVWAGLNALTKLQYLTLSCPGNPVPDAWVLGGHGWQLKALRNRGMISVDKVGDIIQQYSRSLEIWEQEDILPRQISFSSMPRLRELACDVWVFVSLSSRSDIENDLRSSPLESITLRILYNFDTPDVIEPWTTAIGLFSQSLRVLRIDRNVGVGSIPLVNATQDQTSLVGKLAGLGLVHLEKLEIILRGTEDSATVPSQPDADEAIQLAQLIAGWSTAPDHDDVGSLVSFGGYDSGYASRSTSASRSASVVRDSSRSRSVEAFARMNIAESTSARVNRFQHNTVYEDQIVGTMSNIRSRSIDAYSNRYHDEDITARSRSVDSYGRAGDKTSYCEQFDSSPALAFPSLATLAIRPPRSERRDSLHWMTLRQAGRELVARKIFNTVEDSTDSVARRGRLRSVGFIAQRAEPSVRAQEWEWWERRENQNQVHLASK